MIRGTMKADAVTVAEIGASFLAGTNIKVKAAFINTRDGSTHGWTEAANWPWSKKTLAALALFKDALEEDLARHHLTEGVEEDAPVRPRTSKPGESGSGLGEHLRGGDGDAEQA